MASEWVSILVDAQDLRVYESQPETPSKVPGVIVIMEAFGVNKHIQEVTDRLSREGYVAVAPVLYYRVGSNPLFSYMGDDAEARTKAMGSLSDSELTRDLNATIGYLKSHSQVRADRLGIVGFCVGGRMAYLAATSCPGLSAAVVYYGGRIPIPFGEGPTPFERTVHIQCPVMGNFGELDQNPMPDDVRTIEAELRRHGKVVTSKYTLAPITALIAMSARIAIFIASLTPKSVRQTAQIADGWMPVMIPLERLKQEVTAFRQLVRDAGRDPRSVIIRSPGSVTVTCDIDKAREEGKAHLAFYITNMGEFYREQLVRLGYEGAVNAIRQTWDAGGRAAGAAAVPNALVDSLFFAGPVETCLDRLKAQAEAGIDMHTVRVEADDPKEAAKILERLVG